MSVIAVLALWAAARRGRDAMLGNVVKDSRRDSDKVGYYVDDSGRGDENCGLIVMEERKESG